MALYRKQEVLQVLPELEIGKKFNLQVPNNGVSDEGKDAIVAYLFHGAGVRFGDKCCSSQAWENPGCVEETYLPRYRAELDNDGFEWVWKTTRGTLPKRMAAFWRKRDIKLPVDAIAQLGNLANAHTEKHSEHVIDFTQDFSWRRGDFGDDGSCFWSERLGAKEMLNNMGAYAIRFWEPGDECNGLARAWLVPREDEGFFVLFNAYCKSGWSYDALTMSRILSFHLGLSYRKVDPLLNNATGDGLLWINGRAKNDFTSERIPHGYIVGAPDAINDVGEYDFREPEVANWSGDDDEDDDDRSSCYRCGAYCDDDDLLRGANDEWYCESCWDICFSCCDRCGSVKYKADVCNVSGSTWCDSCTQNYAVMCESCEDYYKDGDTYRGPDGAWYCEDCFYDKFSHCGECDEPFHKEDLDENGLCSDCRPVEEEEEAAPLEATA